LIPDNGW